MAQFSHFPQWGELKLDFWKVQDFSLKRVKTPNFLKVQDFAPNAQSFAFPNTEHGSAKVLFGGSVLSLSLLTISSFSLMFLLYLAFRCLRAQPKTDPSRSATLSYRAGTYVHVHCVVILYD